MLGAHRQQLSSCKHSTLTACGCPPCPAPVAAAQVIFCAAARTAFTAELNRVDARGVSNIASSMQDEMMRRAKAGGSKYSRFAKREVADFARVYHQLRWDVQFVGVMVSRGLRRICRKNRH